MVTRIPLIAGNWKLNQDHLQAIALVQKLAWTLQDGKHDHAAVEVAVFPPFTDLRSVQTLISAERFELRFGAQDVSEHESGAHTGEVSAAMLAKLECSYAIVGHSERRQDHHESDAIVGRKAAAALRAGIVPVICVGETAEDLEQHGASAVPVQQLRDVLAELPETGEIVVAYEPVWAIGSGQAATAEQAQQVCQALRAAIAEVRGAEAAEATRILYGGSVKSGNIAGFMREPDVDGALVGGASLDAAEFAAIARFRSHVGT
ncbi:triose-phosphate isomerase [Agrococcus terreus]|uniref:triose-phosphate isomerase n=1 Tax=Agrococcus terreus TaxID=574649 RepID=UPI00384E5071